MKGMIYQTICPGCGLGCGLYIRESDEGKLSVEHMKSSPVNQGKLCRFAMKLPEYYSQASCKVDCSEVSAEEAIKTAALRLKGAVSVAMLSVGNTSNEEQLAFTMLSDTLGTSIDIGVGYCPETVSVQSLDEIEAAKKIVLFVDPYIQYPLLVRRLLAAKRNGAEILSVGTMALHLADRTLDLSPAFYDEPGLDSDSVIIADIHPNSDLRQTACISGLAAKTGAKVLFMKPFINSEGMIQGNVKDESSSLAQLMEDIDQGYIKTLVTLDSDPVELMPDTEYALRVLSKLDNLIVISSRAGSVSEMADVVIATEPLYRKAGTFLNVEGRLQENSGTGTEGIDALSELNAELGGNTFDYQQLHSHVIDNIGRDTVSEEETGLHTSNAGKCSETLHEGLYELRYLYNPFMWADQTDDNDFVILSRDLAKKLGLKKGGMVSLGSEKGNMNLRYRIGKVPGNQIMTARKLPLATGTVTVVAMEGY